MLAERKMTAKEALDVFGKMRFLEIVNQNEAQIAIEMLQTLVERDTPIPIVTVVGFTNVNHHCPKCNEYFDVSFANDVGQLFPYNYCPYCGQRLEW